MRCPDCEYETAEDLDVCGHCGWDLSRVPCHDCGAPISPQASSSVRADIGPCGACDDARWAEHPTAEDDTDESAEPKDP